jgi:predicted secreted protein
MDLNVDKVRNVLEKDIENDLDSLCNQRRSDGYKSSDLGNRKDEKDSLVLIGSNRYELFEKLKKTWNFSHQRIKDFHQKKIQKYKQIFRLKYMYIFDSSDYTFHKRIRALSKYTVLSS